MVRFVLVFALFLLPLAAQGPAPATIAGAVKATVNQTFDLIIRSAEKMPEDQFGFKPTPEVRSFGQLIGHLADAGNMFCSAVAGKPNPDPGVEKAKTTKADLTAALKAAKEFCVAAVANVDETTMIEVRGNKIPALNRVIMMNGHTWEHYGNLVTYLRMKGLVPPSSEPRK
jgi:uncharacterized damage-inducible protein DinB